MKLGFKRGAAAGGKGAENSKTDKPWSAVSVITPYLRRYALRILFGFLALILVDVLQLWIPRIIKGAVDELQRGTATPASLFQYGVTIVLIALLIGLLRFLWRILLLGFSRLLERHLRNRLVSHILTLDKFFYQRKTGGEIMALATNDLSAVQMATGMGLVASVDAIFMGLAAIGFMAYIDVQLTLIAIAPMPILAFLTRFLSARLHQRFKAVQEQFSTLTEFARSTFTSVRLIKAYNQERPQADRFGGMGRKYVMDNLRLASVYGTLFPLSGFIGNISLLLILFFGGRMTINGTLTAGDFVAFVTYLFMITWPMMALGWVADLFQRGITSLHRIQALLLEEPDLKDLGDEAFFPITEGRIEIRDLTFTYPSQREPALREINLNVEPGTFLGIVGRTGAGKTTLCHLLARLYPVPDESIFLDGEDINGLSLGSVRGAIAYVPQDVVLFSDTIAFNIAMGKPDATPAEIEAVARAAAIHDEIVAMSEGYHTRIGERGVKLSGGQRQRLAIARALLLDRPIVIIDDGLSAVDMETEHAIIQSISSYLEGRTCIVVSHRIAPLADAGEIVVMEQGRIVEKGSHEQLLRRSAFYATIYQQQTRMSDEQ